MSLLFHIPKNNMDFFYSKHAIEKIQNVCSDINSDCDCMLEPLADAYATDFITFLLPDIPPSICHHSTTSVINEINESMSRVHHLLVKIDRSAMESHAAEVFSHFVRGDEPINAHDIIERSMDLSYLSIRNELTLHYLLNENETKEIKEPTNTSAVNNKAILSICKTSVMRAIYTMVVFPDL